VVASRSVPARRARTGEPARTGAPQTEIRRVGAQRKPRQIRHPTRRRASQIRKFF
jgi:hypothetical protein